MKNVRRDVREKLLKGLYEKRIIEKKRNATLPNYYRYETPRAANCCKLTRKEVEGGHVTKIWFQTKKYDGSCDFTEANLVELCLVSKWAEKIINETI